MDYTKPCSQPLLPTPTYSHSLLSTPIHSHPLPLICSPLPSISTLFSPLPLIFSPLLPTPTHVQPTPAQFKSTPAYVQPLSPISSLHTNCSHHLFTTVPFPFGTIAMRLVDGLSVRYLQFQEKHLYGGVAFIIKILIKSLSNVSYLFMSFKGDEIIDKI